MIRYRRLLVPVDGSDGSDTAVRCALDLAESTGGTIDVLHVVDAGGMIAPRDGDQAESPREHGRALLAEVEERAELAGVDATTALVEGTPHQAIVEHAADRGSQLVVMGRHGAGSVGERLLGGVTEKVLRSGTLPVLTAWAAPEDDTSVVDADRLLLPTDGSACAELATEHAVTLAAVSGATVHVVSVADLDAAGGVFDAGGLSEEFVENVQSRCSEAVERLASDVEAALDRPAETEVVRGRPSEALADYVEANGVDAAVMGAHGRSGVRRWALGSVTERLLRSVEVPVMVVPGSG